MRNTRFFISLLLFFAVLFVLDLAIGKTLQYLYFKQKQGKLYNITVAIDQQTDSVVIMGSSRAMHHYNPQIITDSLNLSCFNAGYDGQGILYHEALLNAMTSRYTPRVIILDINNYELSSNSSSYDMLSYLNPYLSKYDMLNDVVNLRSKFEKYKLMSRLYPYNSMLARIVIGNLNIKTKDVSENGFTAQSGIWEIRKTSVSYSENELLDEYKVKTFERFLEKCKEKNIDLYVVYSPTFKNESNTSVSLKYIEEACESKDIPYISYQNDSNYFDNQLFIDPDHLNGMGANVFTSDLSSIIKSHHIIQ